MPFVKKPKGSLKFGHTHGPQTEPGHDLSDGHRKSHVGHLVRPVPDEAKPLSELSPGDACLIFSIGGEGALRRRLLDMGLTPGTRVLFRKAAPLGDPLELSLRGYALTLRKEDAGRIWVLPIERENKL